MKGNILVLTVSRIIWSMSMSVVNPYQPLFIQALGGSKPMIGLITALGSATGMVFYPLGGTWRTSPGEPNSWATQPSCTP